MISMALRQFGISCKSLPLIWEACGAPVRPQVKAGSMHACMFMGGGNERERERETERGGEMMIINNNENENENKNKNDMLLIRITRKESICSRLILERVTEPYVQAFLLIT
jgi:hypothetical protein